MEKICGSVFPHHCLEVRQNLLEHQEASSLRWAEGRLALIWMRLVADLSSLCHTLVPPKIHHLSHALVSSWNHQELTLEACLV